MCENTSVKLQTGELRLSWSQARKLQGIPEEKVPLAFARMVRRLQRIHTKGPLHWLPHVRTKRGRPAGLTHAEWRAQQRAARLIMITQAGGIRASVH